MSIAKVRRTAILTLVDSNCWFQLSGEELCPIQALVRIHNQPTERSGIEFFCPKSSWPVKPSKHHEKSGHTSEMIVRGLIEEVTKPKKSQPNERMKQ